MEEFDFTKVIVRLSAILRIFWKDYGTDFCIGTEPHICKVKMEALWTEDVVLQWFYGN